MRELNVIVAAAGLCTFAFAAQGADFDGSSQLICATMNSVGCGWSGECEQGESESINVPLFYRINVPERVIRATRPDGTDLSTKIDNVQQLEGGLVLQGVEGERGWSVMISEATGKMAATASGNEEAFILFGACMLDD